MYCFEVTIDLLLFTWHEIMFMVVLNKFIFHLTVEQTFHCTVGYWVEIYMHVYRFNCGPVQAVNCNIILV